MIITLNTSTYDSRTVLYIYDFGGTCYVLMENLSGIATDGVPLAVSQSYASLRTTLGATFAQVGHATYTNIMVNPVRVKSVSASSVITFDNGRTVTSNASVGTITTALNATGSGGTGDVVGPSSSVDDRLATFDGTTGKLIQDSGSKISDLQPATNGLSTATPSLDDTTSFYEVTGATNNKSTFKALGNLLAVNLPILAGFQYHNDFINPVTSTTSDGSGMILIVNGSGATCTTVQTPAVNRVGIAQTTTGTTSTGRVALATGNTPVRLSGGEWLYTADVNVVQLSTATERFALLIGFLGSYTTINQTNAVYFLYDEGGVSTNSPGASANWACATVSNSSRTITNTSTAVVSGTFVRLQIVVNAAGTSVGFYINGSLVHTETNTIPTAANREVGFGALTVKSAYVAVPALVQYDFINVNALFTTER